MHNGAHSASWMPCSSKSLGLCTDNSHCWKSPSLSSSLPRRLHPQQSPLRSSSTPSRPQTQAQAPPSNTPQGTVTERVPADLLTDWGHLQEGPEFTFVFPPQETAQHLQGPTSKRYSSSQARCQAGGGSGGDKGLSGGLRGVFLGDLTSTLCVTLPVP